MSLNRNNNPSVIEELSLPFLSEIINLAHLNSRLKLLSEEEIQGLKARFSKDGRYSKQESGVGYSIIVHGGEMYAIYKQLGKGNEGVAKLAQDLQTGEWVALKIRDESVEAGTEMLHLNLAGKIVTAGSEKKKSPVVFSRHSPSKLKLKQNMLMKLAPGITILDMLEKAREGRMDMPGIFWLECAREILCAVKQLHVQDIVHRDLSPNNIMYDSANGVASVIDFGFASLMNHEGQMEADKLCGTAKYIAPEFWQQFATFHPVIFKLDMDRNYGAGPIARKMGAHGLIDSSLKKSGTENYIYSEKSEVYALGVAIAELLQFVTGSDLDFLPVIDSESFKNNTVITDIQLRTEVFNFIQRMLNKDPAVRPSLKEAIAYFNEAIKKCGQDSRVIASILDVAEFKKNESDKNSKDLLIGSLLVSDEVYLVDNEKRDMSEYVKLRRELEAAGMRVADRIYLCSPECDMLTAVAQKIADNHPQRKYQVGNPHIDHNIQPVPTAPSSTAAMTQAMQNSAPASLSPKSVTPARAPRPGSPDPMSYSGQPSPINAFASLGFFLNSLFNGSSTKTARHVEDMESELKKSH